MRKAVSRILAASEPDGNIEAVRQLGQEASNTGADAIVLLGSLTQKGADPKAYGQVLKALSEPQLPAFYIPGPQDAPFSEFLREAANFEIPFPHTRCVHGTFAMAPGHLVFAGLGGEVQDDSSAVRDESETLRYPGWEVEYRLKFLQELKDYQKVFLFTTSPEHKGFHDKGSAALAEIIKSYNPRVVLVAGREPKHQILAKSLVTAVGSLAEGYFTSVDLRKHEAIPGTLGQPSRAA
jgi:uncharacterized protein